jgi:tRNA(fMet)-specific endonuclease VapC
MVVRYLLDTNICIYITKQKPLSVMQKFESLPIGSVGISIITCGELFYGANKSHYVNKTKSMLHQLIELIPSLALPVNAAEYYGSVRAQLEKQGKMIGNNDLWIAAHALAEELVLVSNNLREFSRISKLKVENWVE